MSRKTIDINPDLFTIGGFKTRKNKVKLNKTLSKPFISPSILKNKLLKRIKDYKNKETVHLENNKKKIINETNVEEDKMDTKMTNTDEYTNEFND